MEPTAESARTPGVLPTPAMQRGPWPQFRNARLTVVASPLREGWGGCPGAGMRQRNLRPMALGQPWPGIPVSQPGPRPAQPAGRGPGGGRRRRRGRGGDRPPGVTGGRDWLWPAPGKATGSRRAADRPAGVAGLRLGCRRRATPASNPWAHSPVGRWHAQARLFWML